MYMACYHPSFIPAMKSQSKLINLRILNDDALCDVELLIHLSLLYEFICDIHLTYACIRSRNLITRISTFLGFAYLP